MTLQLRRAFGTIHVGHLGPEWFEDDVPLDGEDHPAALGLESYFLHLSNILPAHPDIFAGAFALEEGAKHGRLHIQFYFECKPKRINTLANLFGLSTPAVFDIVKDAAGAWEYCSGTGRHEDKEAEARFTFGTPKLAGSSAKADLKMLVDLVLAGDTLNEICKAYPYAWCVHRDRLLKFYRDHHYGVRE